MEPTQIGSDFPSSQKEIAIAGTLKSCINLFATSPVTPLLIHSS